MKIITVSNQKGGVGKTTTAYNLGYSYAQRGDKVLFVDLDRQANLSILNEAEPLTLDEWKAFRPQTFNRLIDIVPASKSFPQLEDEINREIDRNAYLKRLLLPVASGYDVVIIDTPPSLSILNINAYCTSNKVLIVVNPDSFSLAGLAEMRDVIEQVKTINYGLEYRIILNAFFNGRRFSAAAMERLQEEPGYLNVEIPHRQHIVNSNALKRPSILDPEINDSFKRIAEAI